MSSQQGVEFLGDRYEDVPGGPWVAEVLDIACGDVRGECGWHITPRREEELVGSGAGRPQLLLPTSAGVFCPPPRIDSVRVVDEHGELGQPLLGWRRIGGGRLFRAAGWPRGEDNLVVQLEHGYEVCPDDLLAVVAERVRAIVGAPTPGVAADSKTVGSVVRYRQYVSTGASWSVAARSVLDRYRLVT